MSQKFNFDDGFLNSGKLGETPELFSDIANEWAKNLEYDFYFNKKREKKKVTVSATQFRKFFDKVLELNNKANGLSQEEFETNILPFVRMINSKVAYSKTRGLTGNNFEKLMNSSIKNVNSVAELQNFKYFLEAIIGYMPK